MMENLLNYANKKEYVGNCPEHDEHCVKNHDQNCIKGREKISPREPDCYMNKEDESYFSDSTATGYASSLNILNNRLCRSKSRVFLSKSSVRFHPAEEKCQRGKGVVSYRVGHKPSYMHLQKPSVFNRKKRKQTGGYVCSPKLQNKLPKKCFENESTSECCSSEINTTQKQDVQMYPVCVYEPTEKDKKQRCDEGRRENFPFKSTPSGNYKLCPNQVVYESKNLSIVAAQPDKVCLNVTDPSVSTNENTQSGNLCKKIENDNYTTTCLYTTVDSPNKVPFKSYTTDTTSDSDAGNTGVVVKTSELSLSKMGYVADNCIEWKNLKKNEMPKKSDLQKLLMNLILNRMNPDVQVKIGDSTYKCHKIVLQCYCTYFNAEHSPVYELPESEVPKETFSLIYQWMIHLEKDSYLLLKRDNILDLLKAARFLGVKELDMQCWAFIDNTVIFSEDRAFLLYLQARQQRNKDIMELMVPRVQRFFLTLVSSKEFVEFTLEEVCTFLRSNYICIHNEMEVFMAAVRWLDHDWTNRKQHVVELMKCVRFGFINPEVLITLRRNPQSPEFQRVANMAGVTQMIDDGVALVIAKFYYQKDTDENFHKNLTALGLSVPAPRNWAGTDKDYHSYQEFLRDLYHYRSKQKIEKRHSKMKMEIEKVNKDDFLSSAVLPPASEQKIRNGKYSSLLRCIPQMNSKDIETLQKLICKDDNVPKEKSDKKKEQSKSTVAKEQEKNKKNEKPSDKKRLTRQDTPATHQELDQAARKIQRAYHKHHEAMAHETAPSNRSSNERGNIKSLTRMRTESSHHHERYVGSLTNPLKDGDYSRLSPPENLAEMDKAARVIQHAYRRSHEREPHTEEGGTHTEEGETHTEGGTHTEGKPTPRISRQRTSSGGNKQHSICGKSSLPALLLRSATQPPAKCEDDSLPLDVTKDTLYIMGGADPFDPDSQKNSQQIFMYVTLNNSWHLVSYMPQPLFYHCALFCLGKLYIAGGKNPNKLMREEDAITNKVWRFEPEHKRWVSLSDMIHPRRSFSLVSCNNKIYAIGGRDDKETVLDSVEMYTIETNEWAEVSPLNQARAGAGACELRGRIWVAGGIVNLENIATNTVEIYHPLRDQWTFGESLRFTFSYTQMLTVRGKLYLIGGTIGLEGQAVTGSGKQIDVFDPKLQTWCLASTMSKPRHGHAAAFLKGKNHTGHVLIMGGMSTKHKTVMHSTECWREEDDSWILGVAPIPHPVSGLQALSMPPDIFS